MEKDLKRFSFDVLKKDELKFEILDYTFTCRSGIPVGTLNDLVAGSIEGGLVALKAMCELIRTAVLEQETWDELIRNPELLIPADTIAEIFRWLFNEYLGVDVDRPIFAE